MKKILVCCKSLKKAGTEVACINLLKLLAKERYDVTLLLYNKEGSLMYEVPESVKICIVKFKDEELCRELLDGFFENRKMKSGKAKMVDLFIRIMDKINPKVNHRYKFVLNKTNTTLGDDFDYVLDFQGYGFFFTAYVAQVILNGKKLTWVHDENVGWISYIKDYLDYYDYYCGVSVACAKKLVTVKPQYKDKIYIFPNILDRDNIIRKSVEIIEPEFRNDKITLLTVGRLEDQKGYPNAVRAAWILKQRGHKFKWYFIGDGPKREEISNQIKEYEVEDVVILLGAKDNPYPYIKSCTIYVQPSKHEGYGLAIAEARILEKCVVATDLDCIREQIRDGKNGYLVKYDAEALAEILHNLFLQKDKIRAVETELHNENRSHSNENRYFKYNDQ